MIWIWGSSEVWLGEFLGTEWLGHLSGSMAEDSYEGDRDKSGVCLDNSYHLAKFMLF